jgi:S1-C subfamily serine protease
MEPTNRQYPANAEEYANGTAESDGTVVPVTESKNMVVNRLYLQNMLKCSTMKHINLLLTVAIVALFSSCFSMQPSGDAGIPSVVFNLTQTAVFEVVQVKPVIDSVVYEKELDWSKIPYAIRNDKYFSIGTAFAISKTELITAFHVIDLGFESTILDQYFIRNKDGEVFEVDQIVGGSNEKDFLIFTVKGKTFDSYFEFDQNSREGQQVFSVGNALGEGIVIRNGLILGTVPEEDSRRWNLLKTSADGNPGNSGGPLVRSDGKVVALVTALQDNILYSVPASVILSTSRTKLDYRLKMICGHLILANNFSYTCETSTTLPQSYQNIRDHLTAGYHKDYTDAMTKLFKEAPEYLTGPNNRWILNSTISTVFPQIDFVDPDDSEWTLSNLNNKSYNLIDDGNLVHTEIQDWNFYKLNKPKSVSLAKSYEPRYIMDTILQTIYLDRTMGNDKYRILSFGDPEELSSYRDFLGREWLTAQWPIEFVDQILIMYILPLPNGPAVITIRKASAAQHVYEWDIRKICDHIWAAYSGTFEGWNDFFRTRYVPDFLKSLNYRWQEGPKVISFNTGDIAFSVNDSIFNWTNSSELFLGPSHYMMDGKINFGIRRITLHRDSRYKESISIIKRLKPDSRLPTNSQEAWNDVLLERFPFDGKPAISAKDNEGTIGGILKSPSGKDDLRYTLYLSMENPQNDDNVLRRFNSFRGGVQIRN